MKKIKIYLLMFFTIMFVSCGSKKTDEKVTIKVASWNVAAKALQDVAKEYEKQNPNIKVDVMEVDAEYTKLTTSLASGQGAPDVFSLQARDTQSFLNKFDGQFLEITDKMEKDGIKDKFLPAAMSMVTKNGKVYAFPWDMGPVGLYYRKDMFEKAGVSIDDIDTYDKFIEAGKKIQEANPGVFMTAYQADNDFFSMLFNQAGGSYVKNNKINIDSPEAKKAFDLMVKMKDNGVLLNINDWNGRIVALNNNKVATLIYPVWYVGTLTSSVADQKGKWGITEIPAYEKDGIRRSNLGGSVLAISSQSKHPDIAYDFIKFALTNNAGEDIMVSYGLFPSYTPYYDEDNFKKVNDYFGIDVNTYFAKLSEGIPSLEYGSLMLDSITPLNNLTTSVMNGRDINESLKEAANSIQRITNAEINK